MLANFLNDQNYRTCQNGSHGGIEFASRIFLTGNEILLVYQDIFTVDAFTS